jgi:hypothetical protein
LLSDAVGLERIADWLARADEVNVIRQLNGVGDFLRSGGGVGQFEMQRIPRLELRNRLGQKLVMRAGPLSSKVFSGGLQLPSANRGVRSPL